MRSLLHRAAVVTSVLIVTACGDQIICACSRAGAILRVNPDRFLDSAAVGSTTPRVMTLEVINDGGGELPWRATIKHASPWLSMAPDTGTAGVTPAPQLQANPTGLVVGSYRDTVIVEDRTGTGSLAVPVEFRIYP